MDPETARTEARSLLGYNPFLPVWLGVPLDALIFLRQLFGGSDMAAECPCARLKPPPTPPAKKQMPRCT